MRSIRLAYSPFVLATFLMLSFGLVSSPIAALAKAKGQTSATYAPPYAELVVDARSGKTLYGVNPDAQRHPASITKVMTLYLLFEDLEAGRLSLGSQIKISAWSQKQAPSKPVAMTLRDHEKPGESPIHIRGNSKTLGRSVPRGGLSVISGVPFGSIQAGSSGRSVFAKWLTDKRHPLTARVMVNRIWLWVFGDGLVSTADNFGTTGQLPTNPDLLDHLATRFMENGWSVKHLLRDIVLSKTYAMSDRKTPESEQKDPQNLLLSRFPRRRLDAESMRDAMLMSAGVLDMRVGGPNIEGATSIDSNDAGAALV
ncbi:MAG: DUF1553 domain-containing protein, partial [Pseudomonadota bacterium]